jgi:hypothetical protein
VEVLHTADAPGLVPYVPHALAADRDLKALQPGVETAAEFDERRNANPGDAERTHRARRGASAEGQHDRHAAVRADF